MFLPLYVSWRRAGVVPKFEACDLSPTMVRQRLRSAGLSVAAAGALMVTAVVARWGWIEIGFGVVLGAVTWRRLARQAAR
jgi:hypothetical protein